MNTLLGGWIVAAAAAVFVGDLLTPMGYAVPMLFVLPILLTWMTPGRHSTILMVCSALLLTWIGAVLSPGVVTLEALTNRAMASALLLTIGWLLLIHKESAQRITAAQQARDESEERLRLAQSAEGFGTFDWDIPGQQVIWSPETERIWGLPVGGFEGTYEHWQRLVHPDDVAEAERMARLALDNSDIFYSYDHRIIRPDGTVRWIHAKATTVRDAAGRPIRMVGVNADITERKRAEAALATAELHYRTIFQEAGVGVAQIDSRTGQFLQVNRKYCEIVGLTEDEMLATTFMYITHPDDLAEDLASMERLRNGELSVFTIEKRYVKKDGSIVWVSLNVAPLWQAGEMPTQHIAVVQDITARKLAEETLRQLNETLEQRVAERTAALQETEERFRGIFEHAAEGIAITDLEGRFVQCNAAYAAIVGYPEQELRAVQFESLIHPDDRAHNMALVQQLVRGEVSSFAVENRYLSKSGAPVWVHKHGSILRNDQGTSTHLMALVTDISSRKQVEETLQRNQEDLRGYQEQLQDLTAKLFAAQEQERQRIARDLHDDVSQRLAALVLDVSLLERQPPQDPESMGCAIEPIRTHLEQLADDVHNLAYRLHPSLLNHAGLRPAIEDHLREVARRTGIPVVFTARQVPDAMPQDHAMCLFRVMQESVQNIVKHACATDVAVRLSGSSKGVGLSVMDDGRGFNLGDEIAQQKGLGLASMQERMRLANGFLRIHSRPGRGTKVCAWIPRVQEHA